MNTKHFIHRIRRWIAYHIYPELRGDFDRDLSLEIDRLIHLNDQLHDRISELEEGL